MQDIVINLISLFWICLESAAIILLFSAFLIRKREKYQVLLGGFLNAVLATLVCNHGWPEAVRIFLVLGIYMMVMPRLFQGNLLSHFLLMVIGYSLITLLDVYFINGVCWLLDIPYQDLIWHKRLYVILVTIGKLLSILFTWFIRYVRKTRKLGELNSKWLGLMLIFPVASLVMLYTLFTTANRSDDVSVSIVIAAAFLTVANIAILYVITALERTMHQERDLKLLKQQMAIQADHMKAMELNYRTQRRATHEFERHLQTIQNLITNGEYNTVTDYVSKLQKDRALRIVSVHSHHPVMDAILNQKHQLAQEGGIKMQIDVNDLSGVCVETDKLVVLLANLLDNAIEACLRLESNREIHCRVVQEACLYIGIRNTSLPVEIKDGIVLSSKGSSAHHGYGLPAVRYVLAELNAEYTFDYSDGWFRFAAEIP